MKTLLAILIAFSFSIESFAQDKGTIPPEAGISDPMLKSKATVMQKISLKMHIKKFLKKVTAQKRICKEDKHALAETDFTDLYLNLNLTDSPYITPPALNNEKCGDDIKPLPKHHPDIACIFKDNSVQKSLKEVLEHPAYFPVMSEQGKAEALYMEMTEYYQKLIKDYEHKN